MKIISIINLKGGVAKTLTADNMAHVLAVFHKKRVLLVDNDKQGNTSKAFGVHSYDDKSLSDVLTARRLDVREVIKKTRFENIDVLPATALNAHANNSDIHVNPTTMGNYDTAIAGLIDHTEDTEVHVQPGERAAWDAGAEAAGQAEADAAEALSAIAGLESRVSRVEDGLFNNITGNPFLVQFDSLDGVVMTKGIWNAARNRIEC